MKWFDYLKRTSVGHMVIDWREFVKLKKMLRQAERDMLASRSMLVRHYGVNDDINRGNNACLKSTQLVDEFGVLVNSPCNYYVLRCSHFVPEGNEQKCPHNLCAAWKDNNRYCEIKQRYNDLKAQCEKFWIKRIERIK